MQGSYVIWGTIYIFWGSSFALPVMTANFSPFLPKPVCLFQVHGSVNFLILYSVGSEFFGKFFLAVSLSH